MMCAKPHCRSDTCCAGKNDQGVQKAAVRAGGLPTSAAAPQLRPGVRIQVLAEHDVIRDQQAVEPSCLGLHGVLKDVIP